MCFLDLVPLYPPPITPHKRQLGGNIHQRIKIRLQDYMYMYMHSAGTCSQQRHIRRGGRSSQPFTGSWQHSLRVSGRIAPPPPPPSPLPPSPSPFCDLHLQCANQGDPLNIRTHQHGHSKAQFWNNYTQTTN